MEAVRIAQFTVAGGRAGEAVAQINQQLIPRMESAPGFQRGYWLLDEASGDGIAVTVWDSEAARTAFGQAMREVIQAAGAITNTVIKDLPLVATATATAAVTVTATAVAGESSSNA